MAGTKMTHEEIVRRLEREEIVLASFGKRAWAAFIDEMLISMLFIVIYYNSFAQATTYEQIVAIVESLLVQFISLKIIYQTFFTWYYGASLGKIAAKIVCVDIGVLDKPNFMASLARSSMRVLGELCFFLGFAWAFGNEARQTWHDRAARTVVINVA